MMNNNTAGSETRANGLSAGRIILLAALFIAVRAGVIFYYNSVNFSYYYGMVSHQYAIAEAAFNGHFFSQDKALVKAAADASERENRPLSLEEWGELEGSGEYTFFPAADLPGFGYVIAYTSKWLGGELTAKPAHMVQLAAEFAAMICLALCAGALLGGNAAFAFGLFYIFFFPFIWPLAFQPMRDIFNFAVLSFYVGAFFVFSRGRGWKSAAAAASLLCLSCLLLWAAPRGYYFMFMAAPAAFFLRHKAPAARAAFFAACIVIPLTIFGLPHRNFNMTYHGRPDPGLAGRYLWQGMGISGENKYGFVLDDSALVPFMENIGRPDVEYGSVEMNLLLGEHAAKIVREDPAFYLRTVAARLKQAARYPLPMFLPQRNSRLDAGLSQAEFLRAHPADAVKGIAQNVYGATVFHLGLFLAVAMFFSLRGQRVEFAVFIAPALYLLAVTIPLHFEARYLAPGAAVLILPLMWGLDAARKRFVKRSAAKSGGTA